MVLYLGAISLDYWMMQAAFADNPAFPTRARMLTLMPHGDLAPVSPDGFKRLQKPVRDARAANAF